MWKESQVTGTRKDHEQTGALLEMTHRLNEEEVDCKMGRIETRERGKHLWKTPTFYKLHIYFSVKVQIKFKKS